MSTTDKLMDFKNDIFNNIPKFITDLDKKEQLSSITQPRLFAIKQQGGNSPQANKKGSGFNSRAWRGSSNSKDLYCRLCHKCDMPRETYKSHNLGDPKCTQLSAQDKSNLSRRLSSTTTPVDDNEDRELMVAFGYDMDIAEQDEEQVKNDDEYQEFFTNKVSRNSEPKLCNIKSEPTQILTVYNDKANKKAVHIDLDSGATLNYIRESEAFRLSCKISPNNSQTSMLGDGLTELRSVGEIDITFFRNDWQVRYRAVVVKSLQSPIIGGTVFLKDNKMEQNLFK